MNWYRKAQYVYPPIAIVSYNSYGNLGITFNGGPKYTYPDVSPFYKDKIEFLLRKKNYKAVQKLLTNLAPKKKEPTLPKPEAPKKPQQEQFSFMD